MIDLRENVKIILEDEDFLVVYKPSYLPTVPLKNDNKITLLSIVSEVYNELTSFSGYSSWESGVLHRLDNNTSGLVLIARNKKSFEYFLTLQKRGLFKKDYLATSKKESVRAKFFGDYPFINPLESKREVIVESFFRYYGKNRSLVLPVLDSYSPLIVKKSTGFMYKTKVEFLKDDGINYVFSCSLTSGFKHQIRSHMAWSGFPLLGDLPYGGASSEIFGLEATSITFLNPKNDEEVIVDYRFQK
ncbi:MAG: RNA pseudouridine synthase [Spirochaetaceae bacterium]|nr:RNA pseudouridine synthase [Spirochaetaceae bacterium]